MGPAHDFLTPHSDATRGLVEGDRARGRHEGFWSGLGRGLGLVALLVAVCSPLWGLAVFFALH
ncbi:MAG TPA: hypothetical protein VK904_00675 [Miltoncostaeaceae bacterium]|nr:hypothetical protein [Miltoncostaeaceae bacterium]